MDIILRAEKCSGQSCYSCYCSHATKHSHWIHCKGNKQCCLMLDAILAAKITYNWGHQSRYLLEEGLDCSWHRDASYSYHKHRISSAVCKRHESACMLLITDIMELVSAIPLHSKGSCVSNIIIMYRIIKKLQPSLSVEQNYICYWITNTYSWV